MNDIITENLIALDIALPDKAAVINEIANLLMANSRLMHRELYIKDVYEREEIVPTGIGDLIAIPHARSAGVFKSSLVYLRLNSAIQWSGEEEARFIFGIAVPEENTDNLHLKILSAVAKKLLDDKIKKVIMESTSKQQILRSLLD
ncbi:MAG: fructose PTS transporter subunit IIA [Bacteroidetes bacterium]|nr:fructose PTS transporter subunit IIA [Bacteroidota bacterium]